MPTGHCDEKTQLDTSVPLRSACTHARSIGNNNEELEIRLLSQAMIFLVSQRHGGMSVTSGVLQQALRKDRLRRRGKRVALCDRTACVHGAVPGDG